MTENGIAWIFIIIIASFLCYGIVELIKAIF